MQWAFEFEIESLYVRFTFQLYWEMLSKPNSYKIICIIISSFIFSYFYLCDKQKRFKNALLTHLSCENSPFEAMTHLNSSIVCNCTQESGIHAFTHM